MCVKVYEKYSTKLNTAITTTVGVSDIASIATRTMQRTMCTKRVHRHTECSSRYQRGEFDRPDLAV